MYLEWERMRRGDLWALAFLSIYRHIHKLALGRESYQTCSWPCLPGPERNATCCPAGAALLTPRARSRAHERGAAQPDCAAIAPGPGPAQPARPERTSFASRPPPYTARARAQAPGPRGPPGRIRHAHQRFGF